MNLDSIQDSTRVVVAAIRHGSILPGTRAEMWRDLYFLPGADLRGGALGASLTVEGPRVAIEGSVYVRGAVSVAASAEAGSAPGAVVFGSCLATPDSVQVPELPFRVRFFSNVYAGSVSLSNCIVYGNLHARTARLSGCVVLGGVFCRDRLVVERSILATFRAGAAEVGSGVSLLLPLAGADTPIALGAPVRVLTFTELDGVMDGGGAATLDRVDLHDQTLGLGADGEPLKAHLLSLDERILDSRPASETFLLNKRFLDRLASAAHLPPADRQRLRRSLDEGLEDRLFELIDAPLPEVDARTPLGAVAARPEVRDQVVRAVGEAEAGRLLHEASGPERSVAAGRVESLVTGEELRAARELVGGTGGV